MSTEPRTMLDASEYRWYQADPITFKGETIGGIRLIAPSKLSALSRAWAAVPDQYRWAVIGFDVNEIPESILSAYDLNKLDDYNALLQQERG